MALVNGGATILQVNPGDLDFGNVTQGQTAQLSLTIKNVSSNNTIPLTSIASDNGDFTFSALPADLAPRASTTITCTYTAGAPGASTGTVTILSDADNSPLTLPIEGLSVAAGTKAISVNPSGFVFANTKVGVTSAAQTFVVTNTGTVNVTVQIPVLTAPFAGTGLPVGATVLTPGQTLTFGVTLTPTGGGYVVNASGLSITSDDPTSPTLIDLEGLGVAITPAYVVVGGSENGYAAFGSVLKQFQATNYDCEDPASATKTLNPSGPGVEARLMRMEIQFEDKGLASLNVTATVNRYSSAAQTSTPQTVYQDVKIGTAAANGSVLNALADLGIEGELIVIVLTPTGPMFLTAYMPRFTTGGEVVKT